MSNQQWNTGQNPEWAPQQPEGGAAEQPPAPQQQEWGQQADWTQQGQTSATEWGQPQPQGSAQDWNQAQPQQSAGDWQQAQPSATDWNQQAGATEWGQAQQGQQAQGWDQGQQQWGQQPQQQGGYYAAGAAGQQQPQWAPQQQAPKKPSPFDFSFKQQSLPGAAGTIFLIGSIGLAVWWLFRLISGFGYVADYPLDFFVTVLGSAGLAIFGIMLLRAVLEIGVAVTGILNKPDPVAEVTKDDEPEVADKA